MVLVREGKVWISLWAMMNGRKPPGVMSVFRLDGFWRYRDLLSGLRDIAA